MGTWTSPAFEVEFNPVKIRVVSISQSLSLLGKPENRSSTLPHTVPLWGGGPAPAQHHRGTWSLVGPL